MTRNCVVCGQDNYHIWFRPSRSPGMVVQCKNCHFVYINPIENEKSLIQEGPVLGDRPEHLLQSSNLDDIKGQWEEPIIHGYMAETSAKEANAEEALGHIEKIKTDKGKILDFGCFCGLFLSVAKRQGWDSFGIEPLVAPSIFARAKFDLKITTDTLRADSFPPDFFDVITAFQVFEHVIEPHSVIENLRAMLKPQGLFMIEVPNIDIRMVKALRGKHRHFVEDHVSFYSADTLSRLLHKKGFKVREVYYPVRVLSLHHLAWWTGRLVGKAISQQLQKSIDNSGLGAKTVSMSLGDIVSVIAEKI